MNEVIYLNQTEVGLNKVIYRNQTAVGLHGGRNVTLVSRSNLTVGVG